MIRVPNTREEPDDSRGPGRRARYLLGLVPAIGLMLGAASLGSAHRAHAAAPSTASADSCRQGYVWREAAPGDHVCVTPATRDQAAFDNAHAAERVDPGNHTYGPDTCRQGYVWREAVPGDHVCVTPAVRAQAVDDNNQAGARIDTGSAGPAAPVAPDLVVVRDGYDGAGNDRVRVANIGQGYAVPFRIAVIASAQSFSVNSGGLQAGESEYLSIPGMGCGQAVTVIVDVDKQTSDSNFDNNIISFYASCSYGDDFVGNPVSGG